MFGQKWLIFITFQSKITQINHFKFGHVWVIFEQITKDIALLFGQKYGSFSSLFNLQSKSINFKLIDFHCRLKSDENETFLSKKVRL